jgi:hypothetical protein
MKNVEWNLLNESIVWWEKNRIGFNILVGLTGIISLITFLSEPFGITEVFGILFWGVIANVLYSFGVLVEIFNLYYFERKLNFFKFKYLFYVTGTILYCAVTFFFALLYCIPKF